MMLQTEICASSMPSHLSEEMYNAIWLSKLARHGYGAVMSRMLLELGQTPDDFVRSLRYYTGIQFHQMLCCIGMFYNVLQVYFGVLTCFGGSENIICPKWFQMYQCFPVLFSEARLCNVLKPRSSVQGGRLLWSVVIVANGINVSCLGLWTMLSLNWRCQRFFMLG